MCDTIKVLRLSQNQIKHLLETASPQFTPPPYCNILIVSNMPKNYPNLQILFF